MNVISIVPDPALFHEQHEKVNEPQESLWIVSEDSFDNSSF